MPAGKILPDDILSMQSAVKISNIYACIHIHI